MDQLKSNFGLIVLSISIIVGSLILTGNKVTYRETPTFGSEENRIKLSGDVAAYKIPLGINTNSNDVTYNSELKLGEGEKLIVRMRNGTQEKIEGQNIIAKYFHVSKLLTVESLQNGEKSIRYYNAPIKWGNEK